MVSNPRNGWCCFKLETKEKTFKGTPSYLTNVPLDLLDAFINYYKHDYGVAVCDEEGSIFTLILERYYNNIFIIEEKDSAVLYDFSDLDIITLTKELISDIEKDMLGWTEFIVNELEEELQKQKEDLLQRISVLKDLIKGK